MKVDVDYITVQNGDQVIADIHDAFSSGDHVIDFSSVRQIDSTALAVILAAKRALGANKTIELQHCSAQLNNLIAVYGVQSLFS